MSTPISPSHQANPSTVESSPIPGHCLDGRYQICQRLSRGGFAQTYLAQDIRRPGHPLCVVKHLNPLIHLNTATLDETRGLFFREAETLEKLGRHDQIPQLLAYFEDDQEFYLVQEWVDGSPLHNLLSRSEVSRAETDLQRWSEDQVVALLRDVLGTLEFVHHQGVIHRDIKPENLIRRQRDGRIVLIDFGAVTFIPGSLPASPNAEAGSSATLTRAVSSEGYTPIEQIRGKPCPASDLYALGMVGIQALTGFHPQVFEETLHVKEILWVHQVQVSAGLVAFLTTLTRYRWQDRYQTATAALQDLQEFGLAASSSPRATPASESVSSNLGYTPTQVTPPTQLTSSLSPPEPRFSRGKTSSRPRSQYTDPLLAFNSSPPSSSKARLTPHQRLQLFQLWFTPRRVSCLTGMGLLSAGMLMFLVMVTGIGFGRTEESSSTPVEIKPDFLLATLTSQTSSLQAMVFMTDPHRFLSARLDNTIELWDLTRAHPIQTLSAPFGELGAIALSPDGKTLATGGTDANITLWDLQTGELRQTLRDHQWAIVSLTFSPDGQTLVSSSRDDTLKLWDAKTGALRHTVAQGTFSALDISLDGSLMVGGGADHTVRVWDLHSNTLRHTLRGHADAITAVAIAPNSAIAASGSKDSTVTLWNLYTGELLHTIRGHSGPVHAVAISPDARLLATGGADRTIKLRDLHTGQLLRTFRDHAGEVRAIAISPDGRRLISGGTDGTIKVWQMP